MKCKICDKEFKQANHLKIHINYHHHQNDLDNEINYLKSINNHLDNKMLENIKEDYVNGLNTLDLKIKYGLKTDTFLRLSGIKLRSNSESKKTDIYKNKCENTFLKKYGVKNPSQSKEIKEKKKKTFIEKYGHENNFCNKEILIKAIDNIDNTRRQVIIQSSLQQKYGYHVTNVSQIPGVGDKISKSQIERFKKMSVDERRLYTEKFRAGVKYISSQEIRIQKLLNDMGIEYTANGFLCGYNCDIILKNRRIIEVQGDFWHGNPLKYKETDILLKGLTVKNVRDKDSKKKFILEKKGWKIFYLWESEINGMNETELKSYLKTILC